MQNNRRGLALLSTIPAGLVAFGLMACGDDSSSNGGTVTVHCEVTKKDPFTIKSSEAGFSSTTVFELVDGKVVETVEFSSAALVEEECAEYKSDPDYGSVECSGKKIVATGKETTSESEFKTLTDAAAASCKAVDGQKVSLDDDDDDDSDGNNNSWLCSLKWLLIRLKMT